MIVLENRITELLGIKYPIIQGAMALISDSTLASAVSNAGGAGIIGSGGYDAKWIKNEIVKMRDLTDKPFGVNVVLMEEDKEAIIDVICDLKPAFATFGAGNPIPYIRKVKEAGVLAIPVVANLKQALKVEKEGADAIVIEGSEAGGHIGRQTIMALMTNIIPNVSIPVIAAGGIVDDRGFKAALTMGAEGVQLGSRFFVSHECPAHENAKRMIINATDTDSVILGLTIKHDVRGIRNKFADEYLNLEYSELPRERLSGLMKGVYKKAVLFGDVENGFIEIGQSLDPIKSILSCKEIIEMLTK